MLSLCFLTRKLSPLSHPSSKSYDITLSGTIRAQTTVRTGISSFDMQIMVPFLSRSTFSRTLVLVVNKFTWNPPHLWDSVGTSPSDDVALHPSLSFHTFMRMKDAGLSMSSRPTQLLIRSAHVPANA